MSEYTVPSPIGRRTHGVFLSAEEAIETGKDLVCLLHGIPPGFEMSIYKRMNVYVLVSNPKSY